VLTAELLVYGVAVSCVVSVYTVRVPRSEPPRVSVDHDSGIVVGSASGDTEETIRRPRFADNIQIFVGNLPHVFTDQELRDYFES